MADSVPVEVALNEVECAAVRRVATARQAVVAMSAPADDRRFELYAARQELSAALADPVIALMLDLLADELVRPLDA